MVSVLKVFALAVLLVAAPSLSHAQEHPLVEHSLGKPNAPVRIDEYASITCSHCAEFYINTLPKLQKRYIDTGKVRFVLHEFPLNAISLKAAAVAQCMPKEEYFAFIKTLYISLLEGNFGGPDSETMLYQFAALGGLPLEKAKECANDPKLQEAIVKERSEAGDKYSIDATPTFVVDDGSAIINGAQSVDAFAAVLDRTLEAKNESKTKAKAESKK
jgi:protein-disulfide isomerase